MGDDASAATDIDDKVTSASSDGLDEKTLKLFEAVHDGDLDTVELLINQGGVNLEAENEDGLTLLRLAAMSRSIAIAELLISKGAIIEARNETGYYGWTALMYAAKVPDNAAMVEVLLDHGADIHAKDNHGWTALNWAAVSITPNFSKSVAVLLKRGAIIDDNDFDRCLDIVWKCVQDAEVFSIIKERLSNDENLLNRFMLFIIRANLNGVSGFDVLVRMGLTVNHEDEDEDTPLILAAANSNTELALCLIDRGADVNHVNKFSLTAYDYAVINGLTAVKKALVKKGIRSKTVSTDFPLEGVTIADIRNFIAEVGNDNLKGKTTADVCDIVKAMTASRKCSYTAYISYKEDRQLQSASIYLSHTSSNLFLDVFNAVEIMTTESSTVIWFDIFCVNQHTVMIETKPFGWWTTNLKSGIKSIGKVVVVLIPWNNPTAFQSSLCLFEMHCALSSMLQFVFTEADLATMRKESVDLVALLKLIDVREAKSSNSFDQGNILKSIEKYCGGVDSLTSDIKHHIKKVYSKVST